MKEASKKEWDGREYSIRIRQAPLSISIFSYAPYTEEEKLAMRREEEERRRKKAEAAAAKKGKARTAAKKRTLKEELTEQVEKADEAILAGKEKERPVKVTAGQDAGAAGKQAARKTGTTKKGKKKA